MCNVNRNICAPSSCCSPRKNSTSCCSDRNRHQSLPAGIKCFLHALFDASRCFSTAVLFAFFVWSMEQTVITFKHLVQLEQTRQKHRTISPLARPSGYVLMRNTEPFGIRRTCTSVQWAVQSQPHQHQTTNHVPVWTGAKRVVCVCAETDVTPPVCSLSAPCLLIRDPFFLYLPA